MLGYMNREALDTTVASGVVTFFSRSKERLWVKGETSGNFLPVRRIQADCDNDALLITVDALGPDMPQRNSELFRSIVIQIDFFSELAEAIYCTDGKIFNNKRTFIRGRLVGWLEGIKNPPATFTSF